MPEVHGDRLDVSAEEQRFLRRTFHRFALPWMLLACAIGALAGSLPGWIDSRPEPSGAAEDPHLREQIGALRGEIAALSQRVVGSEGVVAKTRDRLELLEGRSGSTADMGIVDTDALDRRFDAFGSRIAALESRVGANGDPAPVDSLHLEKQLDALGERLARLEAEQAGLRAEAPAALE